MMKSLLRKKTVIFFLCVLLPAPSCPARIFPEENARRQASQSLSSATEQDTAHMSMKSPTAAMVRSLVVPGWGQLYNGKWLKAAMIMGAEAGLIGNAIVQNQLAVKATSEIDREFYRENRRLSIWWLGAVILYSIADAFVDAHLAGFDESPDLSAGLEGRFCCLQGPHSPIPAFSLKMSF